MTDTSALYQEVILDHNRRPRNYSVLANATVEERGINPLCGDELTLYLRMDGDGSPMRRSRGADARSRARRRR